MAFWALRAAFWDLFVLLFGLFVVSLGPLGSVVSVGSLDCDVHCGMFGQCGLIRLNGFLDLCGPIGLWVCSIGSVHCTLSELIWLCVAHWA